MMGRHWPNKGMASERGCCAEATPWTKAACLDGLFIYRLWSHESTCDKNAWNSTHTYRHTHTGLSCVMGPCSKTKTWSLTNHGDSASLCLCCSWLPLFELVCANSWGSDLWNITLLIQFSSSPPQKGCCQQNTPDKQ